LPGERDHSNSIVNRHGMCAMFSPSTQQMFHSPCRIYVPQPNDLIFGVVILRTPDLFLVDINSSETAILPIPSFDHGCLPTRHAMNRLHVVYARVQCTDSWTQTELSCRSVDSSIKKFKFGLIENGYILRCSLMLIDKLQRSLLINYLQQLVPNFSIRLARNGFIWYSAGTNHSMIAIRNVVYEHEFDNNIDDLLARYRLYLDRLQIQEDDLFEATRQQRQQRQETRTKTKEKTSSNQSMTTTVDSTAVMRLMHGVVRSILDKIIDQI
jgi:exosome complex RNA-binding protein Rrp4